MVVTIALIALLGMGVLGMGIGAAILLGAILAPTDPVLASDVQVEHEEDLDRVRFGLTGEAGLNDGTAFAFVMLGLGLLDLHDLGETGVRWLAVDLLWSIAAGLAIGIVLGTGLGYLVLMLRRQYRRALGLHEFLTLGLIALSYGLAVAVSSYGFLAVFAAGLALGRIERRASFRNFDRNAYRALLLDGSEAPLATHQATASSYMVREILRFNEQIERIGEVVIVVMVGILLADHGFPVESLFFVPLLLLIIRPAAVAVGLLVHPIAPTQRRLIAWFGIRGIGSLYYLGFAAAHHLDEDLVDDMAGIVITTIAVSIVVHGVSVTPLMTWYEKRRDREPARAL
jgi:sodium/hydrogen antiporter